MTYSSYLQLPFGTGGGGGEERRAGTAYFPLCTVQQTAQGCGATHSGASVHAFDEKCPLHTDVWRFWARHTVTSVYTLGEHTQNTGIYGAFASLQSILYKDVGEQHGTSCDLSGLAANDFSQHSGSRNVPGAQMRSMAKRRAMASVQRWE